MWDPSRKSETYAPTSSIVANRWLCAHGAANKLYRRQWDISVAFANAELSGLGYSIDVLLPKEWGGARQRLLR